MPNFSIGIPLAVTLVSVVGGCASPAAVSTAAGSIDHVAFSRDGKRWAAIERGDLGRSSLLVGEVGGAVRQRFDVLGADSVVAWSGDDRTLVFGERRTPPPPAETISPGPIDQGERLVAFDSETGERRTLLESDASVYPIAAPRGAVAAFLGIGPGLVTRCHLVDLTSAEDAVVAQTENSQDFKWSPDGERLAYKDNATSTHDLIVVDRKTGKKHPRLATEVQQFYWVGNDLAIFGVEVQGAIVTKSVDGETLRQTAVQFPYRLAAGEEGPFWPSPSGTRLLGYGGFPTTATSGVFGVPEKRLLDTSSRLGSGGFYNWLDDGHLVKLTGTAPYASEIIPIDIPPSRCGVVAEATFDLPTRQGSTQTPDGAYTVEAPYLGGPFRYDVSITGRPEVSQGVANVHVDHAGPYAIFLSKDVPLAVTAGSRFGKTAPGPSVPLTRAAGALRYDAILEPGDYNLELGPMTERSVTIALPQSTDPVCNGKATYFD
jgi:hypothetical protein